MTEPKNILVVEDDRSFRNALATELESDGTFTSVEIGSGVDVLARVMARNARFDAIILGETSLGDDACATCLRLRRSGVQLPIVMIRSTPDEDSVVHSLDSGANDCIVKPVHFGELKARLRAQIRDYEMSDNAVLGIGPYHFRPSARSLYHPVQDQQIHLTVKEAALLRQLHQAGGEPVGRQALLQRVWGRNTSALSHTAETHISRLRRKIEPFLSIEHVSLMDDACAYRLRQNH
ncbi:response regulator transcription factor [Limobrevibacterium gyesilva]|uniref:Response regulator transcription factor n=1 Tax=Limobrevibacterium gyesilva TaxID=2991712 RepID=A0AA41YNP2_9PROT|nr:response regulator transcription factor [Limobrevibacterium gyesilva]MCW3473843.1 response regulator transcription factor [Limobrevibacterium gyesilva]